LYVTYNIADEDRGVDGTAGSRLPAILLGAEPMAMGSGSARISVDMR
jgi:hypothetical protein